MSLLQEDKVKHGLTIHEKETPSCGVLVKTECGETVEFVNAREGNPGDMDCPTCIKEYDELHDQVQGLGIALPGCTFYLVEDSDVIHTAPSHTKKMDLVG